MKLTFITLFLSTTGMFASVNSQNTRVNIHVNNYNPQNEMFRLLGTKRSFSQNETFFFSHP